MKMFAQRVRGREQRVCHEKWAAADGVEFRTSHGDRYTVIADTRHLAASLDTVCAGVNFLGADR